MILRKIKQILGMGSGNEESGRSGQEVVVQEERSDTDAETEAAVKGVDEGGSGDAVEESEETADEPTEESTETEGESVEGTTESDEADEADEEVGSGDVDEPVATGTDASASTESLVDEAEANEDPESRAEPAEAAGPGGDDETTDVDEGDTSVEDGDTDAEEADADEVEEADADEVDDTEVDDIKGIGPAYSDRLGDVGINSVAQLAEADAADLAEQTSVAEGTVQKWIDRAQEFET